MTDVYVCVTCRPQGDPLEATQGRAGQRLHDAVSALAASTGAAVTVHPVRCLSACSRACAIGMTAPGKWTYVFADLPVDAAPVVLETAALYAASEDGKIPKPLRPEIIKTGIVARMPAIAAEETRS